MLRRCLRPLEPWLRPDAADPLEVIVVPNGCTDDTAQIAQRASAEHAGIRVVELSRGSKSAALNAGDEAATAYPRIYLDADIELSPTALPALIAALTTPVARVASPRIRFDTAHADPLVRSFYRVFARLPYVRDGLIGLGVYGVSAAGRARFERFPDVIADDLMIQRLFAPQERTIVDGEFVVRVPADIASLVRVRSRVGRGNAELSRSGDERFAASTQGTTRALAALVRHRPWTLGDALCYIGVTLVSRAHSGRWGRGSRRAPSWERDESTRAAGRGAVGTPPADAVGRGRRRRAL